MSLIAGLLLAAAASCAPAGDVESLLGRWESSSKSRGGIGEVLDLRADGSFVQASAVLVNLRYEVRAQELILRESKARATQPLATPFRIEDGVLIREAGVAPEVRAERSGTEERDPASIVGVWKYRHYVGTIAYERYTADGDLLLRIPMKSLAGCFSVDGSKGEFVFTAKAGPPRPALAYTVEGGTLRLLQPGRAPVELQRDPWGAWYDIDRIDYVPVPKKP